MSVATSQLLANSPRLFKGKNTALNDVAQWIWCCPANRKVAGSIAVRAHAWVAR